MGNLQSRQFNGRNVGNRRSSIMCNLRYPGVVRRREQATIMAHNPMLTIAEWLDLLGLQQYEANLQMYNSLEEMFDFSNKDLKRHGIRSSAHRTRMLNSLLGVQSKRRQSIDLDVRSTSLASMQIRKNSCPPVYLAPTDDICEEDDYDEIITTKSGKVLKILSFDETTVIYEELSPVHLQWYNCSMENGGSSNGLPLAVSPNPNEQQEAIALKKALEWELSLDARELRSHAWYHGPLPRQRAEEIVQREGDFLVRDCASQPQNYVLTCRSKGAVLHFVLNKIILQPETVYERVQYQFEEDAFDAVPDLITFYVGSGKPISAASRALIQFPCNRKYPLSFYGHKIVGNHLHSQMLAGLRGVSPLNSPLGNVFRFGELAQPVVTNLPHRDTSQQFSPPLIRREVPPPRLPSKKQERSQSLTPAQAMVVCNLNKQQEQQSETLLIGNGCRRFSNFEHPCGDQHLPQLKLHSNGFQTIARCNPTSDVQLADSCNKFTTHSLPRAATSVAQALRQQASTRISSLARNSSLDAASSVDQLLQLPERAPSPPPKPGRRETNGGAEQIQRPGAFLAYQASGSDSGNGSGDSALGDASDFSIHRGVIIKNPRLMTSSFSNNTLKSFTGFDFIAAEEQLFTLEIEVFKQITTFDFENYSTLLLPSVDNKPLDGDALNTFKMMLLETGPKLVAEHITRIDIAIFLNPTMTEHLIEGDNEPENFLRCSGLELLTLPHGKTFRDDVIERAQCIKLMVAVTILTCQTDMDRAELISKWIQIAVETKTALGNLFSFCAIMLGLCMQQIQKLDLAWHILRQKYTDSAFTFEAKLRPTLISMNECSNPQAPNTTVPHVLLYALLIDRPFTDIVNHTNIADRPALYTTCIAPWETKADDFGMSINYQHLEASRVFLKNLDLYRKNAKSILEDASSRLDELLSDAFRTEFHVKFLWGSSGATAKPEDRHTKLEKVLTLMADKFCSISA